MGLRVIRSLGLAWLMCFFALPLAAAPNLGKISGVVLDPVGTPQMGATVLISSEQLLSASPIQLLTNDRGRFASATLPAGTYSITVTLAGFLPALEQHIRVSGQQTTLLEIVLGSVFSSLEKLRRQPDQQVATDDWTWVLRTSAATRAVLRWQDAGIALGGNQNQIETAQKQAPRARVELTSGASHPGSVSNLADSPATAFVYDLGIGANARLLMAGQFSRENASSATSFAGEWLPSGEVGIGPVTTMVVRQSQLGPGGPSFRGMRMSHDDQFALGDRVSIRYGAEYIMVSFNGITAALRPRGEVAVQLSQNWRASAIVAARPWEDTPENPGALQSALNSLDAFPTLMVHHGRPVLENGLHEEIAVERALSKNANVTAAVFHDRSTHTAVIGRGAAAGPDFLQDYFSNAFAYDGGASSSTGARIAYRQKVANNVRATVVYAYAGALAPNGNFAGAPLRDQLATEYRHSLAARISTTLPRSGTSFSAGYKWLGGSAVSQQDAYGEAEYHVDPYLSMAVRQVLPGVFSYHMEVHADVGNLLAQGYVPVMARSGRIILVPSYRYLRGGFSLQF